VRISVASEAASVRVQVTDTGRGIPEEALPNIFDRHFQVDGAHRDRTGRGGLGLAIAKRILELHGSAITATSVLEQGATFSFALPVTPVAPSSTS